METINFYQLTRYYARKWPMMIVAILVGIGLGAAYVLSVQQPQYKSSATLLLTGVEQGQNTITLTNYTTLFTSRRVLDPVIDRAQYKGSYETLLANTTAKHVKNTDIITVSMNAGEPKMSETLLKQAITEFEKQTKALYGKTKVSIKTVDAVNTPSAPASIGLGQAMALGGGGALLLAIVGLFFAYDYAQSQRVAEAAAAATSTATKTKR